MDAENRVGNNGLGGAEGFCAPETTEPEATVEPDSGAAEPESELVEAPGQSGQNDPESSGAKGKKRKKPMTKRGKIALVSIITVSALILLFLVGPFITSIIIYESIFSERYSSADVLSYTVDEFDGFSAERHEFTSGKNTLVGYRYHREGTEPLGVVVMAHGFGGGGHSKYLDVAYYFASNGFDVFAYDATGNDESGGAGTGGLPQGVIDLDNAIGCAESIEALKDLPVVLWGHSWGAYSACSVLAYRKEVQAVAEFAGLNGSRDMLEAKSRQYIGDMIGFALPFITAYEKLKFGGYAGASALGGFGASEAGVFVVHSEDDETVSIGYGYDRYYDAYKDDPRFTFVRYADRGHNKVFYSDEVIAYIDEFNRGYAEYFSDHELNEDSRRAYIEAHLDRSVWRNRVDPELFGRIVSFYKRYIGK